MTPPPVKIGNTLLPMEEFIGLWWDSHLSFKKHISCWRHSARRLSTSSEWSLTWKWGRDRDTLLMLYCAIVRSKFDYGRIVYGTASNTNLRQLDSIHNSGLRLALGAFCTSPVSSLYAEANKLLWRNVGWSCPCITMWKLVPTLTIQHIMPCMNSTEPVDLYAARPNGRGGVTWSPAPPIGLKVEEAMTSA